MLVLTLLAAPAAGISEALANEPARELQCRRRPQRAVLTPVGEVVRAAGAR